MTATNIQNSDEIYMRNTDQFNHHDDLYAANKDNMLDWDCKMVKKTTELIFYCSR